MVNGFSKWWGVAILLLVAGFAPVCAQYRVHAEALTADFTDLRLRDSKVYDQNGEVCALIIFETPIPKEFKFDLGKLGYERREDKDDEIWLWLSPDAKKMTIRYPDCTPHKDFRVSLKAKTVYHSKLTTGLPAETATMQNATFYCEHTPFYISIDGAKPLESLEKNFYTRLPIGMHSVAIEAKLYKPYSSSFRVVKGRPYVDSVRLADNFGLLRVDVTPADYQVYVNDELQEMNGDLKLEPGHYKISVRKERYESFETTLNVQVGGKHLIKETLNPAFATFVINAADEDTEIWIDGKPRGHQRASVELEWGMHTIEGRREGYDTWEFPVRQFSSLSPRTIKIPRLTQQFGGIRISCYPPEAMIYVDGKLVKSPEGVFVDQHMQTGLHHVHARLTDYTTARDTFTIRNGKMSKCDLELTPIALGTAMITTDPDVSISRYDKETDEYRYLAHTSFNGKLPAGENIIELKTLSDVKCYYKIFINDKEDHEPVVFPFKRKFMVRKNVIGGEIMMKGGDFPAIPIKANKKLKMDPLKYEISITKDGYQTYTDSIDLSLPEVPSLIYKANLRKLNDSTEHKVRKQNAHLKRFYDNAGNWYIGIFDLGYTFDLNGTISNPSDFRHIISFGVLPIRYKMFGFSLLDFEVAANASPAVESVYYRPSLSLFAPCDRGFAFRFYGGFMFNLYDAAYRSSHAATYPPVETRTYIFGGLSMRFNYVGKFPVDIFTEYKWPVKGVPTPTSESSLYNFRVGISFSSGIDL